MAEDHMTLAQILKEGPVLVDTCALIGTLFNGDNFRDYPVLTEVYLQDLSSRPIYLRPGVIREYLTGTDKRTQEHRRMVVQAFVSARRVLQFSEAEQLVYDIKSDKMVKILSGIRGNISLVDYDLLVSASVLGNSQGASILSLDYPLLKAWNGACNRRYIVSEKVRFFIRADLDKFRRAVVIKDPTFSSRVISPR